MLLMAFCWDEILVKRQTIEKLNLQFDLLFKADICKESFTLLESLLFQFDMKSTMRSKLKTCLSSELLDSNVEIVYQLDRGLKSLFPKEV